MRKISVHWSFPGMGKATPIVWNHRFNRQRQETEGFCRDCLVLPMASSQISAQPVLTTTLQSANLCSLPTETFPLLCSGIQNFFPACVMNFLCCSSCLPHQIGLKKYLEQDLLPLPHLPPQSSAFIHLYFFSVFSSLQ